MSSSKQIILFELMDQVIFSSYYLPPLSRKSDGLPIGAVSGFARCFQTLEDVRSDEFKNKPTHFAVIFDLLEKILNEIYSDYKANRDEAPEDLAPQFQSSRKSVEAFNLPALELNNYEADDLIATYSKKITEAGAKVTVISSDKDLMQLVSKKIRLFDPMKSKVIGEKEVLEKFGVKPEQVIDVQSLAGDTSDNIPGVPGIGIKTASELINKYKNLDNLLNKASEIKQNKRRESLITNKDKAILSKKLVTLKNDVPIKNSLDEFLIKNIDKDKLYTFLREMEFNRLLSQAINFYGEPEKKISITHLPSKTLLKINTKKYKNILQEKDLDKLISQINEKKIISVDTETSSLNPQEAQLIGISVSYGPNISFYIPIGHTNVNCLKKDFVLSKFKPILEDESIKKVGQNIKYDYIIFKKYDIELASIEDTMLLSYTLDAGNNRHNMDTLSEIHLGHKTISYKDLVGTGKKQLNFSDVSLEKATEYAAEDVMLH